MALSDFFNVPGGGSGAVQPSLKPQSNLSKFFNVPSVQAQPKINTPAPVVSPTPKITTPSIPSAISSNILPPKTTPNFDFTSGRISGLTDTSEEVFNTDTGPVTTKKVIDPNSKSMTFIVGEGLTPKQSKKATDAITAKYGQGDISYGTEYPAPTTIKFPFVDAGIDVPGGNNPIINTTKFFSELPDTIANDIRDTVMQLTEGETAPKDQGLYPVESYLQRQSDFQDSLAQTGMTPTQQQWLSSIYGISSGVFDFATAASILDDGVAAVAANAPVKDEAVVAASNLLGNPETLDQAEMAYRNIQKISHPDLPGGSEELSKQANNAISVLRSYSKEQEGFLAQIGMPARDVMKAEYQSKILTPYVSDAEEAEWLQNYGISRSPDVEDVALARTGRNRISGLLPETTGENVSDQTGIENITNEENTDIVPEKQSMGQEGEIIKSRFKTGEDLVNYVERNGAGGGAKLNTAEMGQLIDHLSSQGEDNKTIQTWGGKVERGTVYKSYGGGRDIVLGKVKDTRFPGDSMIVAQINKNGQLDGKFRTHATPIGKKDIITILKNDETKQLLPEQNQTTQKALVSNLSPINTQSGFINPAEVTKNFNDALQKIKDNIAAKQEAERIRTIFTGQRDVQLLETNQLRSNLQSILPDSKDQEALLIYREFKGNSIELGHLLDGKAKIYDDYVAYLKKDNPDMTDQQLAKARNDAVTRVTKYSDLIKKAMNPTPAMIKADGLLTDFFSKRLAEGQKLGFLDSGIESSDYINHILIKGDEVPVEGKTVKTNVGGGAMNRRFNFAKERTFDNILDAVAFGKKPATLNALDAMTIYGQKFGTTAATNILIPALKDMKMAKWSTSANAPKGWVPLGQENNQLFQNLIPITDKETGESHVMVQRLYVPQSIADTFAPILDPDYLKKIPGYSVSKFYQSYIKGVELSLSLFHVKALTITAINNMGYTNFLKVFGEDMGSQLFLDAEKEFVKNGGTTSMVRKGSEAYKGLQQSSIPSTPKQLIKTFPVIKQIDQLAKNITKMTFDVVQRKFKVVDFTMKQNAWMAAHPDADSIEATKAFQAIAKEVNAAYGGLHWENLGISKMTQGAARVLALAPDWAYSNYLNVSTAFKDGPAGTAARAFWIRSVVTGIMLTEATSILIARKLSADPTSVYLGKDKVGKNIYSNIFFAGAPSDVVNLFKNVEDYGLIEGAAETVANKLASFPRFAIQMLTNRDYAGRTIVPKGSGPLVGTARTIANAAVNLSPVPFSISGPAQMFLNPAGNYTLPEYIISALTGSRTRHTVPSGERVITSGKRKGQLAPAIPTQQNTPVAQVFGAPINKPKKK